MATNVTEEIDRGANAEVKIQNQSALNWDLIEYQMKNEILMRGWADAERMEDEQVNFSAFYNEDSSWNGRRSI